MILSTEEIWEQFSDRLRLFILKRVRDEHDADDILQDVFAKIHANLPNLKAQGASFRGAHLTLANLKYGEFPRASFHKSNLERANCQRCDFYNAYFKGARTHSAHFGGANFKFANLAETSGLEDALELEHALYYQTFVTQQEKNIIQEQLE